MKAPRSRWSGVIFIAFPRLSDDGQRLRQERAHQWQQLRPIERCYRHRWGFGREEVEFRRSLKKLGWAEGLNILIDIRWPIPADVESMQRFAKELVALQPD